MSFKAGSLKNNESQKKAITRDLTSIMATINDNIRVAYESGADRVTVAVPITFNIPYMTNSDAQRIIYFHILKDLLERDFIVQLDLKQNATIFYIRWISDEEEKEIELQKALIAKYSKSDPSKMTV